MYKINSNEKELLLDFKNLRIPPTFKFDYLDAIMLLELVDFDICGCLLNGKEVPADFYDKAWQDFDSFKNDICEEKLEDEEKTYYEKCLNVMKMFEKYCGH